jgi:phage baseplate assembly protein W
MDDGDVFGRGLAFPPRLGPDGRMAWSRGPENVRESIRIILLTEAGERLMLPEFGGALRSFLFEPNNVATRRLIEEQIVQALRQWEPRIAVESVAVVADPSEARAAVATIRYTLIATRAAERVSVRVRLTHEGALVPLTIPTLDDRGYRDLLANAGAHPGSQSRVDKLQRQRPGRHDPPALRFHDRDVAVSQSHPGRNRRKFLTLLGIPLRPASSAQA